MRKDSMEFAPVELVKKFQENALKESLLYLSQNSTFYKNHFKEHQIQIHEINTLEDLTKIPTITKLELQRHNDDFLCVPKNQIIDYVTTSGTLGDPVVFALTDRDLHRLAENECLSLGCTGMKKGDTIQLMTTLDRRFMAGLAYFLGVRKMGASMIRVGAGIPELQWDTIKKLKPTHIIAVPSFVLKLISYAEKNNITLTETSVKGIVCIGESIRNAQFEPSNLANKILNKWPVKLFSTYASTEMSTAFTECEYGCGGHLQPSLLIAEILDEEGNPVPPGTEGELTITHLGVQGMPLLRFRTGDILVSYPEKCRCGRTSMRVGSLVGRKQQMIKYKGTTLYPPAIKNALENFSQVLASVVEISTNEMGVDEINLKIYSKENDSQLEQNLKDHFRAKLRVAPKIEFLSKEKMLQIKHPDMTRKPIEVIDKRV